MDPLSPCSAPSPLPALPSPAQSGLFARKLAELEQAQPPAPPAAIAWLKQANAELVEGEQAIGRILGAAMAGKAVSNVELLALQAGMYRYTITIDLVSKVIAGLVDGLKTLWKVQV